MTEDDYWPRLEYRVTRELAGMENETLRSLWCDGFIPEQYVVDDADPHITGHAWICTGSRQDRWEFRLDIRDRVRDRRDVPWITLLPDEEMTGWLTVDVDGRTIRISPGHAPRVLNPRETIIPAQGIRSLAWAGEELIDFAGGGTRYRTDGSCVETRVRWAFHFDAAVTAGDFAVIYSRLGTKALLLKNGALLRELNRSFYFADTYEYPVCLVDAGGDVLLIHCPDDYNRLEIEDAATGARLTARQSKPSDFFHSRLAVNGSGTRLLSAGWLWHPWDSVVYFDLREALRNPRHLDALDWSAPTPSHVGRVEESSACWLTESHVVLAGGDDDEQADDGSDERTPRLLPNGLAVYDTSRRIVVSSAVAGRPAGTMMPVGETHVITLYEHPRLVRLRDGIVEHEWRGIASGSQTGSILRDTPPPTALDPANRRLAIAQPDGIHILEC